MRSPLSNSFKILCCLGGAVVFLWLVDLEQLRNSSKHLNGSAPPATVATASHNDEMTKQLVDLPLETTNETTNGVPLVSTCFEKYERCKEAPSLPLPGAPASTCQSFRLTKGTPENSFLQLIHLEQALNEDCIRIDEPKKQIAIDHKNARNVVNGCAVGVIFPRSLVAYCSCGLWQTKNITYMFSGFNNAKRKWVSEYANHPDAQVQFTQSGRDVRKETGLYDYDYYDKLMASKFALAPDGAFPWTYRFLEGILCGAIPVIPKRTEPEEQEVGYKYCVHNEPCTLADDETARRQAAQHNWQRFLRRHTLVME